MTPYVPYIHVDPVRNISALLVTAALVGTALPVLGAGPASAEGFSCRPESQTYTVVPERAPVHARFRSDSRVVDFVYRNNQVHASWDCTNSSGQPWVCIAQCRVDEDAIEGHWVHRTHLR